VTDAPIAEVMLAAVEVLEGRAEAGEDRFARARDLAVKSGSPRFLATVAALTPACTGRAVADRDARADDPTRAPFLEELMARLLARRVAAGAPPARVLTVGPELGWVRPPDGARLDLARKPVLQKVIAALLAAHRDQRGRPLTTRALLAAVWPDDRSDRAALENRLWVAVSALRRLGLAEVIQKHASGYRIDPGVEVADEPAAAPRREPGTRRRAGR
jgi:hypothetical protein